MNIAKFLRRPILKNICKRQPLYFSLTLKAKKACNYTENELFHRLYCKAVSRFTLVRCEIFGTVK